MVEQNVMDEQPLSAKYRGHLYSRGLNSQLLYNANGMGLLLKSYMYYNRGERSHLLPHALSAAIETVSAQFPPPSFSLAARLRDRLIYDSYLFHYLCNYLYMRTF